MNNTQDHVPDGAKPEMTLVGMPVEPEAPSPPFTRKCPQWLSYR